MKNCSGKTMSFELDQDLEHFTCRFFESHGAVFEIHDKRFEALLPERLSGLLGTPEHILINRGAAPESDSLSVDGYSVNYGSHLLEKMVNAACCEVPLLACKLEFDYLKSQGFSRMIRDQFSFNGSVGRVENWAKVKSEYLFLTCRYVAQSDEQKEGLLDFMFNLETGAHVPNMIHTLSTVARKFEADAKTASCSDGKIRQIVRWVEKQTKAAIREEIRSFQESMSRRFRRDVTSLEEYYASLREEMEKSLKRPGLSDQLIKDRKEKIGLLPDEIARKKDDLYKKYGIKVKVEPCSAMLITTPAIKILYRASIGRKHKNLSLIYNPVTKSVDPLVCQSCGLSATSIFFCEKLHLLCPGCSNRCPVCQKRTQ